MWTEAQKNQGINNTDSSDRVYKSAISFRAWRRLEQAQEGPGPNISNDITLAGSAEEDLRGLLQAAGAQSQCARPSLRLLTELSPKFNFKSNCESLFSPQAARSWNVLAGRAGRAAKMESAVTNGENGSEEADRRAACFWARSNRKLHALKAG